MKSIDLTEIYGNGVANEELEANGFFKVAQTGSSYILCTYYNPETDEVDSIVARDYDRDCTSDNDSIYDAPINAAVRNQYLHNNGFILEGDLVMVIKGRKVPVGTLHVVKNRKAVYDKYGRKTCDYLIFEDGLATNEQNCIRVINTEKAG